MIARWIPWTWLPSAVYRWLGRWPQTCWANLVMRKIYGYEAEVPIYQDEPCNADVQRCGTCYCGKRRVSHEAEGSVCADGRGEAF